MASKEYEAAVDALVRYGIGSGMGYPDGAAMGALDIVLNIYGIELPDSRKAR